MSQIYAPMPPQQFQPSPVSAQPAPPSSLPSSQASPLSAPQAPELQSIIDTLSLPDNTDNTGSQKPLSFKEASKLFFKTPLAIAMLVGTLALGLVRSRMYVLSPQLLERFGASSGQILTPGWLSTGVSELARTALITAVNLKIFQQMSNAKLKKDGPSI